jgi:hypothetical protein
MQATPGQDRRGWCPGGSGVPRASRGSVRSLLRWWLLLAWLAAPTRCCEAQTSSLWDVTPYRVHLWVVWPEDGRVPVEWGNSLPARLKRRAESQVGASWTVTAERAPLAWSRAVLAGDVPPVATLYEQVPGLREYDKLMLVVLRPEPSGVQLRVRQLDLLTLTETGDSVADGVDLADIEAVAVDRMAEVFMPVIRIERNEEELLHATLRAGLLARPEASQRHATAEMRLRTGQVLQPVLRRSDQYGRVSAKGIQLVDWTVLAVDQVQGSQVTCRFESGYRQPFRARRSSRVDQLAVLVKPWLSQTTLQLVERQNPSRPLAGYEVYRKGSSEEDVELLGATNWRGELVVPVRDDLPLQTLMVRNGQQLLGKLPLVPGTTARLTAGLRNDDQRLEAEGFLAGVQESVVDLVARREVLAARVRKQIEEGELEEAAGLLEELRRLDTQDVFLRRVQQRRQSLQAVDGRLQQQIDQLFADTRSLLGQFLGGNQVEQLSQALEAARARTAKPSSGAASGGNEPPPTARDE